jgi:hypothetical protein
MVDDVERVFFHELGHMVAHEINKKYYNGTGTKSIDIWPAEHNRNLFVGEAKVNLSDDEKEKNAPTYKTLPEYLASSTYGCIFQSYLQNEELKKCFENNGKDDSEKWYNSLRIHNLDDYRSEVVAVEREYYAILKEKQTLDELMALDFRKYTIDKGNKHYSINVEDLRNDISDFVENHKITYNELLEKYRFIFEKYKTKTI